MFKRSITALLVLCALGVFSVPAFAVTEDTGWEAYSQAYPTNLKPGGSGTIQVDLFNTGAVQSNGAITVTDTLPSGLEATKAGGMELGEGTEIYSAKEEEEQGLTGGSNTNFSGELGARWRCTGNGSGEAGLTGATVLTCTSNPEFLQRLPSGLETNQTNIHEGIISGIRRWNGSVSRST